MTFRIIDKQRHQVFERAAGAARERALVVPPFLRRTTLVILLGESPREVTVITRFYLDEFLRGVSDLKALDYLLTIGAKVKGLKHLHSRAHVFGSSTVVVTSANLTQAGLFRNAEFGVESDDPEFVRAVIAYLDPLWEGAVPTFKASVLAQRRRRIAEADRAGVGTPSRMPILRALRHASGSTSSPQADKIPFSPPLQKGDTGGFSFAASRGWVSAHPGRGLS